MNLSYTPIKDAYNLPKIQRETKTNSYTDINNQKSFLQSKSLPLNSSIPYPYDSGPSSPYIITQQETHQPKDTFKPKDTFEPKEMKTLKINISDPVLIQEFGKYNPTYLEEFLKEKVLISNKPIIETFMNNMDSEMKHLLMILSLIFIIDILIRCK